MTITRFYESGIYPKGDFDIEVENTSGDITTFAPSC
jgi:hypothetical protein